jgi:hypothetical protein
MWSPPAAATIASVADATGTDTGTAVRAVPRPAGARRSPLAGLGLVVLGLGTTTLLAGCYRAWAELSEGRIPVLVPVAVDAPLAAEFLVLVGGIVLVAAGLLIAASRRPRRP